MSFIVLIFTKFAERHQVESCCTKFHAMKVQTDRETDR